MHDVRVLIKMSSNMIYHILTGYRCSPDVLSAACLTRYLSSFAVMRLNKLTIPAIVHLHLSLFLGFNSPSPVVVTYLTF